MTLGVEDLNFSSGSHANGLNFHFLVHAYFAFIKIPMITYKQFSILFPEGSDATVAMDQSLLRLHRCISFVTPSSQQSPPSAHAFNNGFLNILFHFSHYLLFLWEDFTQTLTPIIANMLMTPSPLGSIWICLL